jgi:hypothetical protein
MTDNISKELKLKDKNKKQEIGYSLGDEGALLSIAADYGSATCNA